MWSEKAPPKRDIPQALPIRHARFRAGLLPVQSPLLRESLLVSFPPLSNMLKLRGLSSPASRSVCLVWDEVKKKGERHDAAGWAPFRALALLGPLASPFLPPSDSLPASLPACFGRPPSSSERDTTTFGGTRDAPPYSLSLSFRRRRQRGPLSSPATTSNLPVLVWHEARGVPDSSCHPVVNDTP